MNRVFNSIQRVQQTFLLGLVLCSVCLAELDTRSDQDQNKDHHAIPSITTYRGKRVICRDGWIPAKTSRFGPSISFVCVKLYRQPHPWQEAQDVCRSHNSFLVKLETRIGIGQDFMDQVLRNEGIEHVWSGLHVDESKLVWDEMQPTLIESYVGQSESFGKVKRGWKWAIGSFDNPENTCGAFAAGKHKHEKKRTTRSANPEEESSSNYSNNIVPNYRGGQATQSRRKFNESTIQKNVDPNDKPGDTTDDDLDNHLEGQVVEVSNDVKTVTPIPLVNVTEFSSQEVTDGNSKEITTQPMFSNNTTDTDSLEYTSPSTNDIIQVHKRSTIPQEFRTTTEYMDTTDDSREDNSNETVTPAPIPTASAPAKGTSSSTVSTIHKTDSPKSPKDVDDAPLNDINARRGGDSHESEHSVSAATLPEETSVTSKGQTAPPKSAALPGIQLPSLSDMLTDQADHLRDIDATMELEDCEKAYPFLCYSEPIQDLQADPHCGSGWTSHSHLDKCYMVIETPLNQHSAAKRCVDFGGRLADVFITFYGNITALAFQLHPRRQNLGTHAWVAFAETRLNPQDTKCDAILGYDIAKVDCTTKLPSVCEKPVPISDVASTDKIEDFLDSPDKVKVLYMTSNRPGTLICPLRASSPEDLILWYKDGVLIQDLGSVYLGVSANQFKMDNQNRFSNALKLDMSLFRRLKSNRGNTPVASMLQGKYWCEVWRRKPFKRIKSMKYLIRYSDVITLFGTIQTKGVSAYEAALFNWMNTAVGLPHAVSDDLFYINNNVSRSVRTSRPLLNDAVSEIINVDNETGRVEFMTYLSLSRDAVPEQFKSQIVAVYLNNMNKMIHENAVSISQHWNVLPDVSKYIFFSRTDVCQAKYLEDELTGLGAHFPVTSINTTSRSVEICDGKAAGSARCIGNLEKGAYWNDWVVDNECGSFPDKPSSEEYVEEDFDGRNGDEVEIIYPSVFAPQIPPNPGLVQLEQIEVEENNVLDVSDKMADILTHSRGLTEEDITTIAKVMDKINAVPNPSIEVGKNMMTAVDKVLDASGKVLDKAETHNHAATRILSNMEDLANKANLGKDKKVRLVTPNVAMEVWDLDENDVPVIGLGAMVAKSWSLPFTEPRIMTIRDRSDSQLEDFDVAIELPKELVQNRMKRRNSTRLSMFIYRKIGLFKSNSSSVVVNSPIISASINGMKVENLQEKVRIVFRPFKKSDDGHTKCVFWDFEQNNHEGGWSTRGCEYKGMLYGKDVCMCDHLTNFAVLLDFYGNHQPIDPIHDFSLSIISMIGLSLSIFGLGMTIVTFLFFKKLRKGRAQQTLFHMALSLLGSELVFLVGIKQTDDYYVCLSVAVLLHYFILVSFMWMLVEAILQYLTFVKVLGTYISRYTLKTAIPAWGIPLLPIIIVLNIDHTLYRGRTSYCWMDLSAFYYAFALPIGLIIVFNIVMFIIIIISLGRRPRGLRAHQSKSKNHVAKTNLKAALTIFVLLGLTWSFGYMAIADARLVFQYIFTFLSSLQGFFIFVLLVARRKQIRDQWWAIFCKEGGAYRKRKSVSVTNSNSNSTASNGSSGSDGSRRNLHNASTRTIDTIIHNKSFDSLYFIPTSSIPTKNV